MSALIEIIKGDPFEIISIDEKDLTYEMCVIAVAQMPGLIVDLPAKFLKKQLYELAVRCDGSMISMVPNKYMSYNLCLEAVNAPQENDNARYAIEYIPKRFLTPELCLASVKRYPITIKWIKNPTPEMSQFAASNVNLDAADCEEYDEESESE